MARKSEGEKVIAFLRRRGCVNFQDRYWFFRLDLSHRVVRLDDNGALVGKVFYDGPSFDKALKALETGKAVE